MDTYVSHLFFKIRICRACFFFKIRIWSTCFFGIFCSLRQRISLTGLQEESITEFEEERVIVCSRSRYIAAVQMASRVFWYTLYIFPTFLGSHLQIPCQTLLTLISVLTELCVFIPDNDGHSQCQLECDQSHWESDQTGWCVHWPDMTIGCCSRHRRKGSSLFCLDSMETECEIWWGKIRGECLYCAVDGDSSITNKVKLLSHDWVQDGELKEGVSPQPAHHSNRCRSGTLWIAWLPDAGLTLNKYHSRSPHCKVMHPVCTHQNMLEWIIWTPCTGITPIMMSFICSCRNNNYSINQPVHTPQWSPELTNVVMLLLC
jgi:hypothetical protein